MLINRNLSDAFTDIDLPVSRSRLAGFIDSQGYHGMTPLFSQRQQHICLCASIFEVHTVDDRPTSHTNQCGFNDICLGGVDNQG